MDKGDRTENIGGGGGGFSGPWTRDQWDAITSRGTGLLLSAGAGTGKTAVLVERVINRISDRDDPLNADSLLVVTFTEAAAAEVRERISRALAKRLAAEPHNEYLRNQFLLLNNADISTMHSFCSRVLRKHFYAAGIDPAFDVLGPEEARVLRLQVLDELLDKWFEDAGARTGFADVAVSYGAGGCDCLRELVLKLYDYSQSMPFPELWLDGLVGKFDATRYSSVLDTPWVGAVREEVCIKVQRALELLHQAAALASWPGGPQSYVDFLAQEIQQLQGLLRKVDADDWEDIRSAFSLVDFNRLPSIKKAEGVDEDLKRRVQGVRKEAKGLVQSIYGAYFAREQKSYLQEIKDLEPAAAAIVDMVRDFSESFSAAKLARGALDFNDLEHYCVRLLSEGLTTEGSVPSQLALELRERYEEILVDEYQDTNALQDAILQLLARPQRSNLVMVGDIKQSIYRFRLAEPRLFLEHLRQFSSNGSFGKRIDLQRNFRSRIGVINGVNFLFKQILTPAVGEVGYDTAAELEYGEKYDPVPAPLQEEGGTLEGPVEVHLLEKSNGEAAVGAESLANIEKEAAVIGSRIQEMFGGADGHGRPELVFDPGPGRYRPIEYGDIAVLLRATKVKAGYLTEVLRQMQIPVAAEMENGFLEAPEIEVILSLLALIDNPRQDIPLAAVLRSPLVGLNASELAEIRLCGEPQLDFYDCVQAAGQQETGLSRRLSGFLEDLGEWRTTARRGGLGNLLDDIFRRSGYFDFVGGLPFGDIKQDNLIFLRDTVRGFDRFGKQGLGGFLRHVQRLKEEGDDFSVGTTRRKAENAIRVMSIHKSKGLEFPVVFIADLGARLGGKTGNEDVLCHRELGLGPRIVDPCNRFKYPSMSYRGIKYQLDQEQTAEELRILYVAMTRARERLILVGSVERLEKHCSRWSEHILSSDWGLPDYYLAGASCPLDWIGAAVARHCDGLPLRSRAVIDTGGAEQAAAPDVYSHSSRWAVIFWNTEGGQPLPLEAVTGHKGTTDFLQTAPTEAGSREILSEIDRRLAWVYPFRSATSKAAKVALSDVKRRLDFWEEKETAGADILLPGLAREPRFLHAGRTKSLARGTATHLVMQHLDLRGALDVSAVRKQVGQMVERTLLSEEEAALVDVDRVAEFFRHPLGLRLQRAGSGRVFRELPFTLGLPAGKVYPELSPGQAEGEKVIVQGVIDCVVDEGATCLLIDFKTDALENESELQERLASYSGQVKFYALALESAWAKRVTEAYLYFISAGRAVKVERFT